MVTVEDAFEVLEDAVEQALIVAQEDSSTAMKNMKFDDAQIALDCSRELLKLQQQIEKLQAEFDRLISKPVNPDQKHNGPQHKRKTPMRDYYRPILEALIELGGKAYLHDVLDLVHKNMQHQLNDYDHDLLPSGRQIRWYNTACWARYHLVDEGLMLPKSLTGIWEISEKGYAWLEENYP